MIPLAPVWKFAVVAALAAAIMLYDELQHGDERRTGRLLRAMGRLGWRYVRKLIPVGAMRAAGLAASAPWRWLCARAADRRQRKLAAAPAPDPDAPTPWTVIDYSGQRAKAIEHLGDKWLLAKPVNRTYPYERPAPLSDLSLELCNGPK